MYSWLIVLVVFLWWSWGGGGCCAMVVFGAGFVVVLGLALLKFLCFWGVWLVQSFWWLGW
jgi:hypothetical protein